MSEEASKLPKDIATVFAQEMMGRGIHWMR